MNKSEAAYFLEGLTAGLAAPGMAAHLFEWLLAKYQLDLNELKKLRPEIDRFIEAAEQAVAEEIEDVRLAVVDWWNRQGTL